MSTVRIKTVLAAYRANNALDLGDDHMLNQAERIVSLVLEHPFAFEDAALDENYPMSAECAERALVTALEIVEGQASSWFDLSDEGAEVAAVTMEPALRYHIAAWQDGYEATEHTDKEVEG